MGDAIVEAIDRHHENPRYLPGIPLPASLRATTDLAAALRLPAGFDAAGFSFAGMPFVVLGHNRRIAWGITNLCADVQDLYLEKLDDPAGPASYLAGGRWERLVRTAESIPVKGAAPEAFEVLSTRHGPLIHSVLPDWQGAPPMALAPIELLHEPGQVRLALSPPAPATILCAGA